MEIALNGWNNLLERHLDGKRRYGRYKSGAETAFIDERNLLVRCLSRRACYGTKRIPVVIGNNS